MHGGLLKSNKGSSLVMAIIIMILMSTLCIAIMMLTLSELNMSRFYSDANRAYFNAEAGVDKIIKAVDQQVARVQEATKDYVDSLPPPSECISDDGSIDYAAYEHYLRQQYHIFFNNSINQAFLNINTNPSYILFEGTSVINLEDGGTAVIISANLTSASISDGDDVDNRDFRLAVTVSGIFGSYTRNVNATMRLLAETETNELPYTFSFQRAVIGNIPSILRKAVVAEKNLLAYDGDATINGDVLAFGTVPQTGGEEDQDAAWNQYGGIMAGMSDEYLSNMSTSEFGNITLPDNSAKTAHLTINGNVATMAGLHTLYGASDANYSIITVNRKPGIEASVKSGNVFSRSVRTEAKANFSKINISGDAYVLDNTELAGIASEATIHGKYLGIVDNPLHFGVSAADAQRSEYQFKRTSAVLVSGESANLYLNGEVFIGGSNFFMDYTQRLNNGLERRPYMGGISALRSTTAIPRAFVFNDTYNKDFFYDIDSNDNPLTTNVRRSSETGNNNDKYYMDVDQGGSLVDQEQNMFYQKQSGSDYIGLNINDRANHFRVFWEKKWRGLFDYNIGYGENIHIPVNANGQINGFSSGAIIANGRVYGPSNYKGQADINTNNMGYNNSNYFDSMRSTWRRDYRNTILDLIDETVNQTERLNYVVPTRQLASASNTSATKEYIDSRWVVDSVQAGKISADVPVQGIRTDNSRKGFFYFGSGDVEISQNGSGVLSIGPNGGTLQTIDASSKSCCIIYARGNIYVNPNVNLEGVLLAGSNVVLRGDATLTCVPSTENMVEGMLKSDVRLQGLFRLSGNNGPDAVTMQTQKITSRNVILLDIREVNN